MYHDVVIHGYRGFYLEDFWRKMRGELVKEEEHYYNIPFFLLIDYRPAPEETGRENKGDVTQTFCHPTKRPHDKTPNRQNATRQNAHKTKHLFFK